MPPHHTLKTLIPAEAQPEPGAPPCLGGSEADRLNALRALHLLDTAAEQAYDDITRLAAQACDAPIALITLVDEDRQWFKSRVGLDVCETSREVSFCAHAIQQQEIFLVPDAAADPRFFSNPLVTGEPHIRSYAGVPLVTAEGHALGSLCVIDRKPRRLTPEHQATLLALGRLVVTQIELRRHAALQREKDSLLRAVVEGTTDAIFLKDLQGRYQMINAAGARFLGRDVAQIIGRDDAQLFPAPAAAQTQANDRRVLLSGASYTYEDTEIVGGIPRTYLSTKDVCRDEQGEAIGIIGISRDITERKKADERLRLLETAVENANDVVVITEAEPVGLPGPRIVYVNPAFTRHTGYRAEEAIGGTPRMLQGPGSDPAVKAFIGKALKKWKPCHVEILNYRKDGTEFWVDLNIVPIANEDGWYTHWVSVQRDITARKAAEGQREALLAEALERADRDPLTGLWNHRAFHRRLEEEADRAQREGGSLTVVMLDLNNFKFFNDAYGHAAGDDVLRRVAAALAACARSYDTLARFGGDEFALLLPGEAEAPALAEGLRERLGERLAHIGYRPPGCDTAIPISASLGIAVFPSEAATRADTVALADERLRRTKSGAGEAEDLIAGLRARLPESSATGFAMLCALVTAVDTKDRYTRRHSEDVLTYCLQIAGALGFDEEAQHTVAVAALLHDVGKVGVPDHVLRKPGRLSDTEFEAVRQHPVMGAAIVGAVPGFEKTLDAVRHHHERWDGDGYPSGLRGEETPLIARLMAVADAFSAMTTDRPYRKSTGHAKALAILAEGSGTQWDPECVAAFLKAQRDEQAQEMEVAEPSPQCR